LKFRNNFEESFQGAEFKMDTDSLTNELLEVRNKNRNRNKETIIIIKTLCQIGKKVVIKIVNILKSESVEFRKVLINF
jgi:hypothetical protein